MLLNWTFKNQNKHIIVSTKRRSWKGRKHEMFFIAKNVSSYFLDQSKDLFWIQTCQIIMFIIRCMLHFSAKYERFRY